MRFEGLCGPFDQIETKTRINPASERNSRLKRQSLNRSHISDEQLQSRLEAPDPAVSMLKLPKS